MKQERIKEAIKLQFELLHLFHKNFANVFHEASGGPYNLNKNQKRAILIIGGKGEIIPSALGKCLDLQKGSLTSMVDALEREELVYRRGDPEDRRKTLVSLTEKGKECRNELTAEIESAASEVLEKLDEEDIISYSESLEMMTRVLKKLEEKA